MTKLWRFQCSKLEAAENSIGLCSERKLSAAGNKRVFKIGLIYVFYRGMYNIVIGTFAFNVQ
jgi:hypothetical protein